MRATLRDVCSGRGTLPASSLRRMVVIHDDGNEIGCKAHELVLSGHQFAPAGGF